MTKVLTEGVLDVAVVGGGISGVYSAWRLATEGKKSVALFEGSTRIGGRLLSLRPPGMPHIKCELGGMRYMSSHTLVRSLVENELKLETRPLAVAEPENLAFLRGRHLRLKELNDPDKVPYALTWAEQTAIADLLGYGLNLLVPGVTALHGPDLQDLLQTACVAGKHIYDHGFWNLLALVLSREAYEFVQQSLGYDTAALNWNAADTILLDFDFLPTATFSALVHGYEQVPQQVCRMFEEAGGILQTEHRLKSFTTESLPDGTEGVRMIFAAGPEGEEKQVLARSLILAMPRRSLELLDQTGPVLGPGNGDIREMIESVTPIPLFKMFVCYHTPWWESIGVTQGRSLTDLPIRQCYYWGTEGQQNGADKSNANSAMLATYDDSVNVSFWAGLQSRKEKALALYEPQPNRHAEKHPGSPEWSEFRAPAAMVHEIQRQLVEMHGVRYAPLPYDAAYKDWGDDPFGGGVNFWNIHARSWEIIQRMTQPKPPIPVYICGEAYSGSQGWAEGALQTAELVLQNHFHLAPPAWVTQLTSRC